MIKVIAIGKKTRYDQIINDYLKRLNKQYHTELILLPLSNFADDQARKIDSKNILAKIKPDDFVILLDEKGCELNNDQLNKKIQVNHGSTVIIIGGPYGVDQKLFARANFVWSLGKLIYPYEIVRLILIEQIYRSQMIAQSHPYHHR